MFLPTSNRLAGFLEISALSIHLAQSVGAQYKAGYLWIVASGNKGGSFGRKSASRSQKRKQKWCAIRDSYLVAVEEPGELVVWDVFLLDANFKIKRSTRYYRQGLNLLHGDSIWGSETAMKADPTGSTLVRARDSASTERKSLLGSICSRVSHMFHPYHVSQQASLPSSVRTICARSMDIPAGPLLSACTHKGHTIVTYRSNWNPIARTKSHVPCGPHSQHTSAAPTSS